MANLNKQYNIKHIGTLIHIIYNTLPLFSIVAQAFAAVTVYGVWRDSFYKYVPWMSLPVFFLILISVAILTVFFVYKFIYLSYFKFQNEQQFPEDGQLANLIRRIVREELDRKKEQENV